MRYVTYLRHRPRGEFGTIEFNAQMKLYFLVKYLPNARDAVMIWMIQSLCRFIIVDLAQEPHDGMSVNYKLRKN